VEGFSHNKNISPERDKQNPIVRYGGIDKAVSQIILTDKKKLNTKKFEYTEGPGLDKRAG